MAYDLLCSRGCVTSKSWCRIFGFFSLFFGLIFLYYWNPLFYHSDRISKAQGWDSLLPISSDAPMKKTIKDECGSDYLTRVTPEEFGAQFQRALEMFVASAIILSVKGVVQFFMTCLDPKHARSLSITILFIDLIACGVLLVGLFLFRCSDLCLLEHTNILHYPRQQTLATVVLLLALVLIKLPEITAILLFAREQHILLSAGETRSKGTRRSEAFVTPNSSRVNSYLRLFKGRPEGRNQMRLGILKRYKDSNDPRNNQSTMNYQQVHSDDDSEGYVENVNSASSYSVVNNSSDLEKGKFEEIDLNDNALPDFEVSGLGATNQESPSQVIFCTNDKGNTGTSGIEKKNTTEDVLITDDEKHNLLT